MSQKMKNAIILIGVILGTIILLCILGSILYIALFTDKQLNIDVATIVSIILALFSIFISMMFYFKATDTSNKFYNNSFNFMKEQSELLGRIDERFTEKLNYVVGLLTSIRGLSNNAEDTFQLLDKAIEERNELNKKLSETESVKDEEKLQLLKELDRQDKIVKELKEKAKDTSVQIDEALNEINKSILGNPKLRHTNEFYIELFIDFIKNITLGLNRTIDSDLIAKITYLTRSSGWQRSEKIKEEIIAEYFDWLMTRGQMPKKAARNRATQQVREFLSILSKG